MANGRFLISRDATGAFRWVLRDADGGAVSESPGGYPTSKACAAEVERLRKLIAKAEVIDLTQPATVIKAKGGAKPSKATDSSKAKGKR